LFLAKFNIAGVFELLLAHCCVKRVNSKQSFTVLDIKQAYQVRLLTTITKWAQHDIKGFWAPTSTRPFDMPLGRDNFSKINAHIDGSTTSAFGGQVTSDLER
jgi:hypothetical protein